MAPNHFVDRFIGKVRTLDNEERSCALPGQTPARLFTFELDQSDVRTQVAEFNMSKSFAYRCPTTGLMVQGFLKEEDVPRNARQDVAVTCLACRQTHFVKPGGGRADEDPGSKP